MTTKKQKLRIFQQFTLAIALPVLIGIIIIGMIT